MYVMQLQHYDHCKNSDATKNSLKSNSVNSSL